MFVLRCSPSITSRLKTRVVHGCADTRYLQHAGFESVEVVELETAERDPFYVASGTKPVEDGGVRSDL
jgi:hypothetical protein